MISIDGSFYLLKRISDSGVQLVEKSVLEGIAKEAEVEMLFVTPEKLITDAAFRNKAVDMGIPFEIPAKGMKNADEAGSEKLGFIVLMKQACDHIVDSGKKAV